MICLLMLRLLCVSSAENKDYVKQRHTFHLMEKLIAICILTLGIQCVSSAGNGLCPQPVCCFFMGTSEWTASYHFNITELFNELSRCEIIAYSKYYFDLNDSTGEYMFNEDKNTLMSILSSNKTVYLSIGFLDDRKWQNFLDTIGSKENYNHIHTLINFLNNFKLYGIILDGIVFNPKLDELIIELTLQMKKYVQNLRVGLKVDGLKYLQFNDPSIFNYTKTNVHLDNYFVDMTISNECSPKTQNTSLNPIINNEDLVSLQDQCNAFNASAMDKCKSYVVLQVPVTESHSDGLINNDAFIFQSYSKVCFDYTHGLNVKRWCLDSLLVLYFQAAFVRSYFSGFMLSMIEGDDFNNGCNCTKYPVTNSLINGWFWEENSKPEKCDMIDEINLKNMN